MIAIVLSLVIVAAGSALLLSSTLHSGSSSSTGLSGAPGVAMADRLQAQQSLSTGLTSAESAAAAAGGYSGVNAAELQQSNPAITFVTGPSTGPTTVSVAVSTADTGAAGGGDQSSGGAGVPSIPGLAAGGGGDGATTGPTDAGGAVDGNGSGAITLADRSSDSVCWLIWKASGSATWYGAQTGLTSCTAPQLSSPPAPGPVSASAIGWQQGGFPPS